MAHRFARSVAEITRQPVEGKIDRCLPDPFMVEKVVFPPRDHPHRFHEVDGLTHTVGPVAPPLLPGAVGSQVSQVGGDPVVSLCRHIGEGGVLRQQGEGGHPQTAETDAAPVAFVGGSPPLVVVIVPHRENHLFIEGIPEFVALLFAESIVTPVVDQRHVYGGRRGADVETEDHIVVVQQGIPGPHPVIDDGKIVGFQDPHRQFGQRRGKFKGFGRIARLPSHLVEKCQRKGGPAILVHLTVEPVIGAVARM